MLSKNIDVAKKIVLADKPPIQEENKITDTKVLNKLIKNISMLSSVYHKLPETFISKKNSYSLNSDNNNDHMQDDHYDDDDHDKDNHVLKIKKQMDKQKYDSYSSDNKKSNHSKSSSDSYNNSSDEFNNDIDDADDSKKSMDLIGLNDDESKPQKTIPPVKMVQVLSSEDAGLKGQTGLSIFASINRIDSKKKKKKKK